MQTKSLIKLIELQKTINSDWTSRNRRYRNEKKWPAKKFEYVSSVHLKLLRRVRIVISLHIEDVWISHFFIRPRFEHRATRNHIAICKIAPYISNTVVSMHGMQSSRICVIYTISAFAVSLSQFCGHCSWMHKREMSAGVPIQYIAHMRANIPEPCACM